MIHLQKPTPGWREALTLLPPGSVLLAVDQVQESWGLASLTKTKDPDAYGKGFDLAQINPGLLAKVEAKQRDVRHSQIIQASRVKELTGGNVKFALRHHYDYGQQNDGTWLQKKQRSHDFFATFIDGTFYQYAEHVDYILGFNEYFADSQGAAERAAWVSQAAAHVAVWKEYQAATPRYAHIKIVIANTAVGNNIPLGIAHLYRDNPETVVVGYHPYSKYYNGVRDPGDFEYFSGRWAHNEAAWGIPVEWMFTEAGPFESAVTGWRSSVCLGQSNSIPRYVAAVRDWLYDVSFTHAYNEGRLNGFALFTTGGPGWATYETGQPELNELARMTAEVYKPGTTPPPDPDPDPPAEENYTAVFHLLPQDATHEEKYGVVDVTHESKTVYGQSARDAARLVSLGLPASKVVVWNAERWQDPIGPWLHDRGVGVVEYRTFGQDPPEVNIEYIVDNLPKHATKVYDTRPLEAIDTLVVHHTTGAPFQDIANIASYHVNGKGWPGIGYHFVIDGAGKVYQTNRLATKSYHAGNYSNPSDENFYTIGIALEGHFGPGTDDAFFVEGGIPFETKYLTNETVKYAANWTASPPPAAQLAATEALIAYLRGFLGMPAAVAGHREIPGASTACPGSTFLEWLPDLR